jgi:uncharacterized membrane protein YgdD (TMEM256/DUF423 family)
VFTGGLFIRLVVFPNYPIIFLSALSICIAAMFSDAVVSHILQQQFNDQQQQWWAIANRYLLINGNLLMICSFLPRWPMAHICLRLIILACLLFSGSLYALSLLTRPLIPMLTPSAGLSMIVLWCVFFGVCVFNFKKKYYE